MNTATVKRVWLTRYGKPKKNPEYLIEQMRRALKKRKAIFGESNEREHVTFTWV